MADTMSAYWANFAMRGDPNGAGRPEWPAYRSETGGLRMNLGPMTPEAGLDPRRLAVFDALYGRVMERQRKGE